jgi:hypothetical protein
MYLSRYVVRGSLLMLGHQEPRRVKVQKAADYVSQAKPSQANPHVVLTPAL